MKGSRISAILSDLLISPENQSKQEVPVAGTIFSCSVTEHPLSNCTGVSSEYFGFRQQSLEFEL